ncbi:MAG TPA: S8 family peptidase [Thermoanaerobaculia bacterium]|nr:S8 family peptidase [Thermoanaerobaculia bacterium]
MTALDPRLQNKLLSFRAKQLPGGDPGDELSVGSTPVDVLARLNDPAQAVPDLTVVTTIGKIVTGFADVARIESIRKHPNVRSLKLARPVGPMLSKSMVEIKADTEHIRGVLLRDTVPTGKGVIVGIVDEGFDFVHGNLRGPDGKTRLLALWDQDAHEHKSSPYPYGYGREITSDELNVALSSWMPYQVVKYRPTSRQHGTFVSDIAAGNGRVTHAGVAPEADLIFVDLAPMKLEDDSSFGNSRRLVDAVDYIFRKADALGRPAVVNLSLSTNGGPHDGTTLGEMAFDQLLATPGRAIVIAAGNTGQDGAHACGVVEAGSPRVLKWNIASSIDNRLEIWYCGAPRCNATLISPGGQRLGPVRPDTTSTILQDSDPVGRVIHRVRDPNNDDNQIDIILAKTVPHGTWEIELTTADPCGAPFHAWIERENKPPSFFVGECCDASYSIGSIACGAYPIAVGAYYLDLRGERFVAGFSSEGPTRNHLIKPEVLAPGVGIKAADARSQGTTVKQGTSMAAPFVTGLVALMMEVAGDKKLPISRIREVLAASGRTISPGNGLRGGRGVIDVAAALSLIANPPLPGPSSSIRPVDKRPSSGDPPMPPKRPASKESESTDATSF